MNHHCYRLILLFLAFVFLSAFSFSQVNRIEPFQNDRFQIRDIDLGSPRFGVNRFSATAANVSATQKILGIDIRTECLGLGMTNWQSQSFFALDPGETRKIEIAYEVSTPLLSQIILRVGESATYFDRAKWRTLPEEEQRKNPPPDIDFFWRKVVAKEAGLPDEKILGDSLKKYDLYLNPAPKESLERIKAGLPGVIRASREEKNAFRSKLAALFRINRECPANFDYQKAAWSGDSQKIEALLQRRGVEARVFSIAGEADNRIQAFVASSVGDFDKKKPLIVLLSGNPPGTKESLLNAASYLCRLGYFAVGIDRRPACRILDKKEKFLSSLADPVFDTLRLLKFLRGQTEIRISKIGIYGLSAGAEEGKFVAALDGGIDAAVLAVGITSHHWMFNNWAWFPCYSGMIIFPELGLGSPDIGHLTDAQFQENFDKLKPEHNQMARDTFNKIFPFFEDLDPVKSAPLIAPIPLMVVTGAQDEQFIVPGVVEVDEAVRRAYDARGLLACTELYIQPRASHYVDATGGAVITAFFDRWLK